MEHILEKTLLFDFYGDLLTEHRKEIYEAVVFNDMSLSEAAAEFRISRQGIHDLIKRCDEAMEAYEDKLHMISRYLTIKEKIRQLRRTEPSEERQILLDSILEDLDS
ncbi:MAG: DNA-binding protein [Lachnospiraceae bacterium]|nr:DNA-binding protein [Lachnospiraceae bacterium]